MIVGDLWGLDIIFSHRFPTSLTPVNTKQKEIVTDTGKPIAGARDKETAEHRPTFESKR